MSVRTRRFILQPIAAAAVAFAAPSWAADAAAADATQQLEQKIDVLAQQIEALKAQLKQLKAQNEALAQQQEQLAAQAPAPAATSNVAANVAAAAGQVASNASLWGYGEIYYSRPVHEPDQTTMDLARAVFGIGYKFDKRTRFNSEFEIEHAVASADDSGEFEVEQFWIDHQLADSVAVKAGLMLIPAGYLNLSHESTRYYGVHRNFVETLIIPSTWREGGVALHGNNSYGLSWDAGLTTGMNLSKWDINPETPLDYEDAAPLQATHQELSGANAAHLSQYLALGYNGIPGFNLGATIFTGVATPFVAGLPDERVTLWEAHSRWNPGRFDLSALYARGTISNTADANRLYPGASNPIPAAFFGYYAQGAYTLWQDDTHRITPFVRWERFNLGSAYEGIPQGFTADPQVTERVWSYGANFYLNPHVVFKADYQSFQTQSNNDRFDLGVGLDF